MNTALTPGTRFAVRRCPVAYALAVIVMFCSTRSPAAASPGVFNRVEISFRLPDVAGNPFDFTQNDVKVTFTGPDGTRVVIPAFFDGEQTWRARLAPQLPGRYTVALVQLNGRDTKAIDLTPTVFDVAGQAGPGFVRVAEDHHRFVRTDGSTYYPVGYNLAWRTAGEKPMPPIIDSLARMGKAGVNWTRIWMNYWDGKNLDWAPPHQPKIPVGELSLPAARLWDQIVDAAEANQICFQMVLQHHGQYSRRADSNWHSHPWNKVNGGWLGDPSEFFTDPKAIALTKAKYRYILARWGCSPSVMAWELFNEVESTDGFRKDPAVVGKWHADMAAFIRSQDVYHHLITTSSWTTEPKLWPAMDYYQPHVYPPDILSAIDSLELQKWDKPYFYGEIGIVAGVADDADDTIHRLLWGSLMSRSSGAAQYWSWDTVEPRDLFSRFTAARQFVDQSGMLTRPGLKPITVVPKTATLGPLVFGPGLAWTASTVTKFTVRPDGVVEGVGGMSAYLQGTGENRQMFPSATFAVDFPEPGTFETYIDQTTIKDTRVVVSVDGKMAASLSFPPESIDKKVRDAAQRVDVKLGVPVPAGRHSVYIENTGPDWVRVRHFRLTPYAPRLGVLAKGDAESALLWVYARDPLQGEPTTGTLSVPGLSAGAYQLCWWDTRDGKILRRETVQLKDGQPVVISTPPVVHDLAAWIRR